VLIGKIGGGGCFGGSPKNSLMGKRRSPAHFRSQTTLEYEKGKNWSQGETKKVKTRKWGEGEERAYELFFEPTAGQAREHVVTQRGSKEVPSTNRMKRGESLLYHGDKVGDVFKMTSREEKKVQEKNSVPMRKRREKCRPKTGLIFTAPE